jgi:hypothetical protein
MTEKLTPIEILKSKQNFSNFMADTPAFIVSTLADYPQADGKVILEVAELTQNFETFANLLDDPMVENLPQPPFVVWTVTNPKDRVLQKVRAINKYATSGFGIFVFKAFLNGDKIDFECLVKPELKTKNRATSLTKTNDLQLDYWNKYVEICDELGLGNYQISAKAQHYADLKSLIKSIGIKQTVSFKQNYVATELNISNKQKYELLLKHRDEIEKITDELNWHNLPSNKNCTIRSSYYVDLSNPDNYEDAIRYQIQKAELLVKAVNMVFEQT